MQEMDESGLLREYVERDSEEAFAALVSRNVNKVYSVALRQTGNPQAAEEITQAVFAIVARKARALAGHKCFSGWLYQTARLTAVTFIRSEIRRGRREQEAHMQAVLNKQETDVWPQIAPLLETAMAGLSEADRNAVVLRYFDGLNMKETGAALGTNEITEKKRMSRAVEKLRKFFTKRGVTIPAAVLVTAISANSVQAAPALLAKTATTVALAKGAAVSTSTLTLIKGALKVMAWTKAKTAVVAGLALLVAAGTTTVTVVEVKKAHSEQVENYFAHWDTMSIDEAPLPSVVLLRPSKYVNKGDYILASMNPGPDSRLMRRAARLPEILGTAYGFSPEEMVLPANLPRGQYDMLLTTTSHSRVDLQEELKRQFGITAHVETREHEVMVIKVSNPNAPGLKVSSNTGENIWTQRDSATLRGYTMDDAAHELGSFFNMPVDNETGLTGKYDIDIHWNGNLQGDALKKDVMNALREQLGLEITPDKQSVKMLVVEMKK